MRTVIGFCVGVIVSAVLWIWFDRSSHDPSRVPDRAPLPTTSQPAAPAATAPAPR